MHDRRCFPVKTNKNIKKNSLAPREILWKCFGTQCVNQKFDHRSSLRLLHNTPCFISARESQVYHNIIAFLCYFKKKYTSTFINYSFQSNINFIDNLVNLDVLFKSPFYGFYKNLLCI